MYHKIALQMIVVATVAGITTTAFAQSSKTAVQLSNTTILEPGEVTNDEFSTDWVPILATNLKVPTNKSMLVGVSMEAGLFTDTQVKSKGGDKDRSDAEAKIDVRVLVDGQPIEPGVVTFARRHQTLIAVFQGIIDECQVNPETSSFTLEDCDLEFEEVRLLLDTMNANAFNFVFQGTDSGEAYVEVEARIILDASSDEGSATAGAVIGKASLVAEEVRLVRGADILR